MRNSQDSYFIYLIHLHAAVFLQLIFAIAVHVFLKELKTLQSIRRLTKLRLEFSELNAHRFRHNFDCFSPFYSCGMANEDNEHFLLHCQKFDLMRIGLLRKLSDIPELDISKINAKTLCEMLLYGNPHLNIIDNRIILEATISFIESTKRLN